MSYRFIYNPRTHEKVDIRSQKGLSILRQYGAGPKLRIPWKKWLTELNRINSIDMSMRQFKKCISRKCIVDNIKTQSNKQKTPKPSPDPSPKVYPSPTPSPLPDPSPAPSPSPSPLPTPKPLPKKLKIKLRKKPKKCPPSHYFCKNVKGCIHDGLKCSKNKLLYKLENYDVSNAKYTSIKKCLESGHKNYNSNSRNCL